ncbi:MAG TPA: response regulator transcription factor [Candidatus Copromorpha excrementigallinarum]|uniref:Stage 0 sporulation protein A homolog n=1 Tax=Candidatus Allocopromorpha excrementigallinarum TaxID=2840742 RepID=A0A9D1L6U6_9FIRM|nr:response regulator transcription factor [Candidatus Copromorpha excrementigallinarum]
MRLLVVEDQKDLNEIIVRKLTNEHYSVDSCFTGDDALDFIRCAEYDGVILDIMLPGTTGIGVLKKMRAAGDKTPVLLLTAMGTVEDRVAGLDAGADDYLVKPFDFDELLARIRAMIRRGGERASSVMTSGDLTLDSAARRVERDGKEISLTAREFDILEYLMQNEGKVLSRDKLSNHIWNYDYDGGSNVIDVYVCHLRKKVDDGFDEKKIITVKGAGYMVK